jgi:hypothetical protein
MKFLGIRNVNNCDCIQHWAYHWSCYRRWALDVLNLLLVSNNLYPQYSVDCLDSQHTIPVLSNITAGFIYLFTVGYLAKPATKYSVFKESKWSYLSLGLDHQLHWAHTFSLARPWLKLVLAILGLFIRNKVSCDLYKTRAWHVKGTKLQNPWLGLI